MSTQISIGVEDILRDLSAHVASALGALGYKQLGMDKDDLLQEIYIRIWRAIRDDHYDIRYLNAYIQKIVYSVFINEIHRINREKEVLDNCGEHLLPANGTDGSTLVDNEIIREALTDSIRHLKKNRQTVIKLRLEGFTLNEIAKLNQWPYRKTCSVFYRGLKELKERLKEKGFDYEDQPCQPL